MSDEEGLTDEQMSEQAPAQQDASDGLTDEQMSGQAPESDQVDYNSPGQQALTGLEGAAQGVAGPLATAAEAGFGHMFNMPELSAEAIGKREQANPWVHGIGEAAGLIGSTAAGFGVGSLAADAVKGIQIAKAAENAGMLAKIGSAALNGAVKAGMASATVQSSDEITKAMTGQGDPEAPVAGALINIGASGALGAVTGGLFSGVGQGTTSALEAAENTKFADSSKKFLAGVGIGKQMSDLGIQPGSPAADEFVTNAIRSYGLGDLLTYKDLKPGIDAMPKAIKMANKGMADAAAGAFGWKYGGALQDFLIGHYLERYADPTITRFISGPASKAISSTIFKAMSEGDTNELGTLTKYAKNAFKGNQLLQKSVNNIFVPGQQAMNVSADPKQIDKIKDYLENGGLNQQVQDQSQLENQPPGMAEGGAVEPEPQKNSSLQNLYPDQAMMLGSAKSRISNYLNTVRPSEPMRALSFDKPMETPGRDRSYQRALEIAASPLSVMNHVKRGTLTPEHVKHLTSMYPEVYSQLSKKITEGISKTQLEEKGYKKPNYKTRMGISVLMGTSLDSTMTQPNIAAAQMSQMPASQPPGDQMQKPKKSTSKLGKTDSSYQTPEQAADADRNKRE